MGKGNAKKSLKRTATIIGSIALLFFGSSLLLMILANYFFKDTVIDIFSTAVSGSYEMNIPFSIIIDIFSSTGGILLGLKIDRFSSEKNEEEEIDKINTVIYKLIQKLSNDIKEKPLLVLSNYKIHWEALLRSDSFSIRALQNDERYFELSDIFCFLDFHRKFWEEFADKTYTIVSNTQSINSAFREELKNWKDNVDTMDIQLNPPADFNSTSPL